MTVSERVGPDAVWDAPMPAPTSGKRLMQETSKGTIKILILGKKPDLAMGIPASKRKMVSAEKGDLEIPEEIKVVMVRPLALGNVLQVKNLFLIAQIMGGNHPSGSVIWIGTKGIRLGMKFRRGMRAIILLRIMIQMLPSLSIRKQSNL